MCKNKLLVMSLLLATTFLSAADTDSAEEKRQPPIAKDPVLEDPHETAQRLYALANTQEMKQARKNMERYMKMFYPSNPSNHRPFSLHINTQRADH